MQSALATLEQPMAKKMGRPTSDRDDATARLDRMVLADCRFVADHMGISLAEYLTKVVQPVVAKDLDRVLKERGK